MDKELLDKYTVTAIERLGWGVELTILDENKGNTKANLVGKIVKIRVVGQSPETKPLEMVDNLNKK